MPAIADAKQSGASRNQSVTLGGTQGALGKAWADITSGLTLWRLWGTLGWNDILQRYHRSVIGPFWLTASMGIMVVVLGVLYAELFNTPIHDFLPFLCVGLLVWNFLSSFLTEGGTLFTGSESYIKQIRLPYSVYVYKSCWSKLIIFGHNFVIYFGVLLYFELWPGAAALLAIPGLIILVFNGALASLYIGMISARFRDIPQLIASLVQIVFFVTPIMWKPELVQRRPYIADWNPFFHMLEIVRAPLLGNIPTIDNYLMVMIVTAINLVVAMSFFVRFRSRIAYWV
jgi:ABC-2 type transport system permease protein/lipopolysaccharide transport system permease protein